MADLLFTAGLDDRGFKAGVKGLVRQSSDVGGVISRVAKFGGGLFGAASVVAGLRKAWRAAGEAVRDYTKENMYAARGIAEMGRSVHALETSFGRLFTSMLLNQQVKPFWQIPLAGWGAQINKLTDSLLGPGTSARRMEEERATREYNREKLIRATKGSVEEDILRLQGKEGPADILRARRKAVEEQTHLRELLLDRKIDQTDFDELFGLINKRLILEGQEALKKGTRSFSGEVPRALRAAISGVPDADREAALARRQLAESHKVLKKIEKNTSTTRPPVYR